MYTSLPSGIDRCACTTVKKLSRVLGRYYDSNISEAGVNITQLAVLRCIARRSGEPLIRVAEEMEMDRTSLYRAIAPMIRDGWLVSADASHARFRTAKVTPKGRQLLTNANKRWEGVQRNVIGKFGQEKYGALLAELNRLRIVPSKNNPGDHLPALSDRDPNLLEQFEEDQKLLSSSATMKR